jgi:Phytanoyl-CoA dioxygenase (PhyH)
MIDDVDMEKRPMMVVPGSHKGPIHNHHGPDGRFCGAMDPENCDIDLSSAVPCLGKAGSITIHHVRAVHGSATNFSGRPRRFLLFQYRAADAWLLLGLKEGIEKFDEQLIVGEPSLAPRLVLPVRMPLPPAEYQGSIYCRGRRDRPAINVGEKPRRAIGGGATLVNFLRRLFLQRQINTAPRGVSRNPFLHSSFDQPILGPTSSMWSKPCLTREPWPACVSATRSVMPG